MQTRKFQAGMKLDRAQLVHLIGHNAPDIEAQLILAIQPDIEIYAWDTQAATLSFTSAQGYHRRLSLYYH